MRANTRRNLPRFSPSWALALRFAARELRGGSRGFRVMLACLALGVAAIAAIGSFSAAVNQGLKEDARILLGGDVDLRLMHRAATEAQRKYLAAGGTVSVVAEMRAMARASRAGGQKANRRVLVELKGVDEHYPLVGAVTLAPALALKAALAPADHASDQGAERVFGAVAEKGLLARLGLAVGDRVRVGAAEFVIRAVLEREPDRASGPFRLGPRMIIGADALAATGLVMPGSLHHYHYRVKLAQGTDPDRWTAALSKAFPDAGWRPRTAENAAPGLRRFVERLKLLLTLIGLSALLVGGIGVGNAVKSYLDGKTPTIAILKCLGAPSELIFRTYLIQIMAMAVAGVTLGLLIGAALPVLIVQAFAAYLPAEPRFDLYPLPLALAGAYGVLTALSFALWPLARAREVSAAHLFRDLVSPVRRWPRPAHIAATLCAATALALLAYLSATEPRFALWFIAGAIATLLMFRFASGALGWAARRLSAKTATRRRLPLLHLALLNLHRPGSPAGIIILSFGTALTVFIALAQIEGNLALQIREKIPDRAPSYYFIDIQPSQAAAFDALIKSIPGAGEIRRMPSLRARIARINGARLSEAAIAPEARWAVRGDRGLTYAATPPPDTRLVAGKWWPADYKGPPVISFDARIARGFGVGVGDTLTFNVLGREITATIANLREIEWSNLSMNFITIFAPGTLEDAPQTHIATVKAEMDAEEALADAVASRFANVTAIRVKEALDAAAGVLANIGAAARGVAALALLAGTLVLGGAVAAGHHRRVYDSVVLKVLGARRRELLKAFVIEYALIGLLTSILAGALGSAAAYFVLTRIMDTSWTILPATLVLTALVCTVTTMAFGFVGTWRALGQKAAAVLRSD